MDAKADNTIHHVDIGKLLAAAGLGSGLGAIDGTAKVKGRGASLSGVLAHGDGAFRAVMPLGGNINALLVDLMGIELGRAFFAAIGVPDKEAIRCALADFVLQRGILATRRLEVNTTEHVITGGGRIDLARELLEMAVRTDPKHFTIGSLPTPILISGAFKDLHYAPAPELAVRGGAAIGLGLLFPPAAVLPTVQFGVGEGSPCAEPVKQRTPR
jgi:AsmA family protein